MFSAIQELHKIDVVIHNLSSFEQIFKPGTAGLPLPLINKPPKKPL